MMPTTLFLDTSIIRGFGFNFSSLPADALLEICRRKQLLLLLPEITQKEIERQMLRLAGDTADSLNGARKKAFMLERHAPWVFNISEPKILVEELAEHLLADWKEFLSFFQVVQLSNLEINLKQVLLWWEEYEAPFSFKKSAEFADAFAASLLSRYQEQHQCNVAILSQDTDWKNFCETREGFYYYSSVASYVETFDSNIEAILAIKSAVKNSNLVIDKICELIKSSSFNITVGWEAIANNINVTSLEFKSLNVLNSNLRQATLVFSASASVDMDLEYSDITIGDHILETPQRFRNHTHSGVYVDGSLIVDIDTELSSVIKIIQCELDTNELRFP